MPLCHPDRIADVEVAAHVAKDDLRFGNGRCRLGDLEWQRELLVTAVEQGRHSKGAAWRINASVGSLAGCIT